MFLAAGEEYVHISSSHIKQIASLAGDKELLMFVPPSVAKAIRKKMGQD